MSPARLPTRFWRVGRVELLLGHMRTGQVKSPSRVQHVRGGVLLKDARTTCLQPGPVQRVRLG